MQENNIDILRKYMIKELIYGIELDNSTHKLIFKYNSTISSERLNEFKSQASKMGVDPYKVNEILKYLIRHFPDRDRLGAACYTLDTNTCPNGTVIYIECKEGNNGNLACLELLKISNGRMLVLSTDDNSLLVGDIIFLANNRLTQTGCLNASVENDEECANLMYESMPISTIRIRMPSPAHEAYDISNNLNVMSLQNTLMSSDVIDLSNPTMSILMGSHLNNSKSYLKIDPDNVQIAINDNGKLYKATHTHNWVLDIEDGAN